MTQSRTLVLGMVLSCIIALGAFATLQNVERAEDKERIAREQYRVALTLHTETVGVVGEMVRSARTLAEWEAIQKKVETLSEEAKRHFTLLVAIGILEALADERDRLLWNAGELYRTNQNDPGIVENLKKAGVLHKRAEELLKTIEKELGAERMFALHMRSAYEAYRSLAFLDPQATAKALNILQGAIAHLKRANVLYPKQNDVELSLEFLYKRTKEEEAKRGSGSVPGKPRALPSERRPGQENPGMVDPSRERRH